MNTMGKLVDALASLLEGNITVPVYRVDVPETEKGNYVIIRPEGGQEDDNNRSLNDNVVVITDVVTKFHNNVNQRTAEAIDVRIYDLIMPTPQSDSLVPGSGVQVLNVRRANFDYVEQEDNVYRYYRKISRYAMRIHQTT